MSHYNIVLDMQDTIKRAIEEKNPETLYTIANAVFEKDEEQAHFIRSQAMKLEQMIWKEEKVNTEEDYVGQYEDMRDYQEEREAERMEDYFTSERY